ncbi:hypothetical protein EVAR_94832_1 [Eumeta japonica]|uniref:Uncharacterized protein n=1 Tax=Eumeta variegata TaxID=151549 RepID=A0A4C1UIL2_EUMVA|nr:hypothetical protein EVAR_94832_1 [Eumeta japonica]
MYIQSRVDIEAITSSTCITSVSPTAGSQYLLRDIRRLGGSAISPTSYDPRTYLSSETHLVKFYGAHQPRAAAARARPRLEFILFYFSTFCLILREEIQRDIKKSEESYGIRPQTFSVIGERRAEAAGLPSAEKKKVRAHVSANPSSNSHVICRGQNNSSRGRQRKFTSSNPCKPCAGGGRAADGSPVGRPRRCPLRLWNPGLV